MQEISNTIKDRKAGEPEVFYIGDVETSTDTVDLDYEVGDHEGQTQQPLHIDLTGKFEEILLEEVVYMATPVK